MISESGNYFLSVGYDPDQTVGSNFPLDNPITLQDGEELEIAVTQVNYPQTFLNVRREGAAFELQVEFGFPDGHTDPQLKVTDVGTLGAIGTLDGNANFITVESPWSAFIHVPVPIGAYSHDELVDLINSRMQRAWEEMAKPGYFLYNDANLYGGPITAFDPFSGTQITITFQTAVPHNGDSLQWTLPLTPARSSTTALANVLPIPYLQASNRKTLIKVALPRSPISVTLSQYTDGEVYEVPSPYVSYVGVAQGGERSIQELLGFCGDAGNGFSEVFPFFGSDIVLTAAASLGGYVRDAATATPNGPRKMTYDIGASNTFNVGSAIFERVSTCQNQLAHRFLHIGISQLANGTNFVGKHLPIPSCALSVPLLEPAIGGGPMLTYSVRHLVYHKVRSPFAVLNVQLFIDDEQIVRPTDEEKVNILLQYRILQTGAEVVQNHGLTLPPVAGYRVLSSNNDPLEIYQLTKRSRQN